MSEANKTKPSKKAAPKRKSAGRKTPPPKQPMKSMNFYWIYAIVGIMLLGMIMMNSSGGGNEIQYSEFKQLALEEKVEGIVLDGTVYHVYLNEKAENNSDGRSRDGILKGVTSSPDKWFYMPPGEGYLGELQELQEKYGFEYNIKPVNTWGREMLSWVFFLVLMVVVWTFIMRRMSGGGAPGGNQIFSIGKSRAKVFEKGESTNVTFKDVAGVDEAKEELEEIVDFLMHPDKYTKLGAKIPKGALLVGPPGTGKTLLAKAVAGEAEVPFFSLSGSDFVEMFVGVGASRVRDLFKQAKEKSPAIIFIDEIDAIGRARGQKNNFGSNDERENTLNQLLTEMDGFGTNSGVIILAATNRADILDKALMRAGRFDRQIMVDMPDVNERKAIFEVHIKAIKLDKSVDVEHLAHQTPGFSGADIANICNEAALFAARKNRKQVTKEDFNDAIDRIIGGLEKRSKVITPKEKKTIAFHEAGHALVSWLLEFASPLVKVSIVPRGQSLGAAWYMPHERKITTTEQIFHEMCATMGGRAAEEVEFNEISTGALSDLEKVTKQATAMVTVYGLSDKIGNISYYDSGANSSFTKPYSEETARIIDEEVSALIEKAYVTAKDILVKNRAKLTELAEALLKDEVIYKDDVQKILGPRPHEAAEAAPEAVPADTPAEGTANEE